MYSPIRSIARYNGAPTSRFPLTESRDPQVSQRGPRGQDISTGIKGAQFYAVHWITHSELALYAEFGNTYNSITMFFYSW